MEEMRDCLFIGHNEMDFTAYKNYVAMMGVNTGAYRDLNLNFIQYRNKAYSFTEAFNAFCCPDTSSGNVCKPLNMLETFNAAIAYLGTYLARRGLTFDYVNSFQDHKDDLSQKLRQENILTIAIITTLYISPIPIMEIINFIRRHNKTAKIILGGPFIATKIRTLGAAAVDYLFKSLEVDFYVNSSQGETALVNIISALKGQTPVDRIPNIHYKTTAGYRATPVTKEANILSDNMVDWSLFEESVGEYASVRTSISCPFACAFCGFPEHAGKFQTASLEAVERELNALDAIGTVKSVHFVDDTFNIQEKRFKDMLKMMIKNTYSFSWHSYFRCQSIDRETVALMKESGCEGVFLGIESGSDRILKNMHKVATTDQYYRGIALLKDYGIPTFGDFIIGFPGETQETVRDTIQFIQTSGLDFYRTQLWYCEPITPIWKEKETYNIKGESFEWRHATMDARMACDLIDTIFCTITEPVWVPQYNFDFGNLSHLLHRGFSIAQIQKILACFNNGIKEKLQNPAQKDAPSEVIRQLQESGFSAAGAKDDTFRSTASNSYGDV